MLTKTSEELISFFIENNCINKFEKKIFKIKDFFLIFFDILIESFNYINKLNFEPLIKRINNKDNIPKPNNLISIIPTIVSEHIHNFLLYSFKYEFSLFNRNIIIYFITDDNDKEKYNNCIKKILMWLYILNKYNKNKCSQILNIYVYLTNLNKEFTNGVILDHSNVNTAYTFSCKNNNDLVVYRKEEWFKVFIHETFHSFGLDFSNMSIDKTREEILKIFNVESLVNLYEAYTETWARIMNTIFVSFYISLKNRKEYLKLCEQLMYLERFYSCFQMIKILNYMSIEYKDIIKISNSKININYKEKTNILSYYIITNILIYNYQDFIIWCSNNNDENNIFQFVNTIEHQYKFCEFIKKYYINKNFLNSIFCINKILNEINDEKIKNNLRMTINELK